MTQDMPFPTDKFRVWFPKEVVHNVSGLCCESHINTEFGYPLSNITIPDILFQLF